MFKNVSAVWWELLEEIKKVAHLATILLCSINVIYPIYSIIVNKGYIIANIALSAITLAYLIYYLIMYKKDEKSDKGKKTAAHNIYKWSKRVISLFTLGITAYGIYFTAKDTDVISLLITAFMVVFWVLDVVAEILRIVAERKIGLLITALKMDGEGIVSILNFFRNVAGDELIDLDIPEKQRELIEEIGEDYSKILEAKKEKKKEEKQARKEHRRAVWAERFGFSRKKPTDVPSDEKTPSKK